MSLRKLLTISLYVFVLIFAIIPTSGGAALIPYQDKFLHALIFIFLSIFTLRAFEYARPSYAFFFLISFGLFIEITQYFIPYRSFEFLDLFADIIGALIGFKVAKKINFFDFLY